MKNEEKTKEFIKTGKRVIEKEARALDLLEKSIEESFSKAVETILRATGRVAALLAVEKAISSAVDRCLKRLSAGCLLKNHKSRGRMIPA